MSLAGRSLLVTGGTGYFGRAFVRFALAAGARRVVVFARGEAKLAGFVAALADDRVRGLVGDEIRLPLTPVSGPVRERLAAVMKELGLL